MKVFKIIRRDIRQACNWIGGEAHWGITLPARRSGG
jgi:hypothetical protein